MRFLWHCSITETDLSCPLKLLKTRCKSETQRSSSKCFAELSEYKKKNLESKCLESALCLGLTVSLLQHVSSSPIHLLTPYISLFPFTCFLLLTTLLLLLLSSLSFHPVSLCSMHPRILMWPVRELVKLHAGVRAPPLPLQVVHSRRSSPPSLCVDKWTKVALSSNTLCASLVSADRPYIKSNTLRIWQQIELGGGQWLCMKMAGGMHWTSELDVCYTAREIVYGHRLNMHFMYVIWKHGWTCSPPVLMSHRQRYVNVIELLIVKGPQSRGLQKKPEGK